MGALNVNKLTTMPSSTPQLFWNHPTAASLLGKRGDFAATVFHIGCEFFRHATVGDGEFAIVAHGFKYRACLSNQVVGQLPMLDAF